MYQIQPALLDIKQVAARLGVCARTIRRMVDAGQLPKPKRVAGTAVRWFSDDVEAYVSLLRSGKFDDYEPPEAESRPKRPAKI